MSGRESKLLITDLDGTLLFAKNGKREFREEDLEAIKNFQRNGNLVVVNSGRTVGWLIEPLEAHVPWDYLIASSGALIAGRSNVLTDGIEVIAGHPISRETIEELIVRAGKNRSFTFQTMHHVYTMNSTKVYGLPTIPVEQFNDIPDAIYGISLHFESEEEAGNFADWFHKEQMKGIACYQNKEDIDMVAEGCSKGTGIEELREYLQISLEKCYAIGDSYNDIEMLKAMPHSFTFRGSAEKVRENASYLVDSVAEMIAKMGRTGVDEK